MPTDADFLAAVIASPHDRLPRLVYADWLDERADPRGELIRLEEETRERVAWDDTLWRLKPRRNELRRQTDADWLKAMDYGQSCEPLFRGQPFPTDVRDAWRLIREAVTRWSHYDTGWDMPFGEWAAEITKVEHRLGLTLPTSVRDFIRFAHDFKDPESTEDPVIYSDRVSVERLPGADAVSLLFNLYSHDGPEAVGILMRHLRVADPPIHHFVQEGDEIHPTDQWRSAPDSPNTTRLSEFMFRVVHATVGHDFGRLQLTVPDGQQLRRRLNDAFPFYTQIGWSGLFERANLSALLEPGPTPEETQVVFSLTRPVSEEDLPAFVSEWCRRHTGWCSGRFQDIQQRFINEERAARGLPPLQDEEIPF